MIRFDRIELDTHPSRPSDQMDFKQKRLLTQVRFGLIKSQKFEKNAKKIKKSKSVQPNFFGIFDLIRFASFHRLT